MSDQYLCGPDMMLGLWDWSSETPSPLSRAERTQMLQAKPCHIALLGFQALPGMGFRHLLGISLSTWWHSFCPKPTFPPALLSFLPSWDFYGYILHCCSWAWELLNDCALFCGSAQAQIHGLMQNNTCERHKPWEPVFCQGFRGSQMLHINNFLVSQCLFRVISLQSTYTAAILTWCWLKYSELTSNLNTGNKAQHILLRAVCCTRHIYLL